MDWQGQLVRMFRNARVWLDLISMAMRTPNKRLEPPPPSSPVRRSPATTHAGASAQQVIP